MNSPFLPCIERLHEPFSEALGEEPVHKWVHAAGKRNIHLLFKNMASKLEFKVGNGKMCLKHD